MNRSFDIEKMHKAEDIESVTVQKNFFIMLERLGPDLRKMILELYEKKEYKVANQILAAASKVVKAVQAIEGVNRDEFIVEKGTIKHQQDGKLDKSTLVVKELKYYIVR